MDKDYETRKTGFRSGSLNLEGLLTVPGHPDGGVPLVICHPHPLFGGTMKNYVLAALARAAGNAGITCLRFNFRGVGASEGSYGEGLAEMGDVTAALDHLCDHLQTSVIDLAGYSFGARVGLLVGATDPRVRKLVGIAPPVTMMDMGEGAKCPKPKLMVRGTRDEVCLEADFKRWYGALPEPKNEVIIEGADHFYQGMEEEIALKILRFLKN